MNEVFEKLEAMADFPLWVREAFRAECLDDLPGPHRVDVAIEVRNCIAAAGKEDEADELICEMDEILGVD